MIRRKTTDRGTRAASTKQCGTSEYVSEEHWLEPNWGDSIMLAFAASINKKPSEMRD
jgi:hypothetical protein